MRPHCALVFKILAVFKPNLKAAKQRRLHSDAPTTSCPRSNANDTLTPNYRKHCDSQRALVFEILGVPKPNLKAAKQRRLHSNAPTTSCPRSIANDILTESTAIPDGHSNFPSDGTQLTFPSIFPQVTNQPPLSGKPGDRWEYPRHRLKFFNILGEGAFGQVWKCEALDVDGELSVSGMTCNHRGFEMSILEVVSGRLN